MKPLKLIMSAFGSFADAQEIDFSELGATGLYLITGETGSGKTTIFDAISFALFGRASGTSRDDYSMLRSDFAAEKAKTYVELDFISGNNKYKIKRMIKKIGQEAVLLLPDGDLLSGDRNIRPKITEIIGLDRDQFAQIVMIAQNDFLRFLQSGTDERLKILRRIFGTESLKQFQERLKTLAKGESDKRALLLHDFERYEVDVYKRDDKFSEWEAQIKTGKVDLLETDALLSECDEQKQSLAAKLAIAEDISGKYADLAKFRHERDGHNAKEKEISGAKERATLGEIALLKVKPLADEAQKAAADHSAAEAGLKGAREQEAAVALELAEAANAIDSLTPLAGAQEAFAVVLKEWEDTADKLKSLLKLHNEFAAISIKRSELEKKQAEFEELNTVFKSADERHRALEEAFLRNQAGIIASSLTDGEPCPVCGSVDHPSPACLTGEDISETKLKKAEAIKEKARSERESGSSACDMIKAEIDTRAKRFMSDMEGYIPNAKWESSESELGEMLSRTRAAEKELAGRKEADRKALDMLTADWDKASKRKSNAESASQSARTLVTERAANEQRLLEQQDESRIAYITALRDNGFTDGAEYASALVTENELSKLRKSVSDYEKKGEQLMRDIARLELETADKEQPDIEDLRIKSETLGEKTKALSEKRDEINRRLSKIESALIELRRAASDFAKIEIAYASIKQLADAANGRLDFETYAQMAYFERVLRAANLRLKVMSQNRYALLRKTDSDDARKRSGLELEVMDSYTGKARAANSLSGGESFMASLSLALGLSDVVQHSAGGIRLDAMFIDEGFGTLDTEVLELAIRTLSEMAGSNRIIGIISHVTELRERIDKQIQVEKTPAGSRIIM